MWSQWSRHWPVMMTRWQTAAQCDRYTTQKVMCEVLAGAQVQLAHPRPRQLFICCLVVGLDKSIMILNTGSCLISIGDLAVHVILVFITLILDQQLCNHLLTLVDTTVDGFVIVGSCHSTSIFLGHDLRVRTFRKLRGLRWIRQHLFYLQPENPWGECTCKPWACWAYRWEKPDI